MKKQQPNFWVISERKGSFKASKKNLLKSFSKINITKSKCKINITHKIFISELKNENTELYNDISFNEKLFKENHE